MDGRRPAAVEHGSRFGNRLQPRPLTVGAHEPGCRAAAPLREICGLAGTLTLRPLDVADQAQYSLPVSGGGYTETDQGVMVQVGEVSGQ